MSMVFKCRNAEVLECWSDEVMSEPRSYYRHFPIFKTGSKLNRR